MHEEVLLVDEFLEELAPSVLLVVRVKLSHWLAHLRQEPEVREELVLTSKLSRVLRRGGHVSGGSGRESACFFLFCDTDEVRKGRAGVFRRFHGTTGRAALSLETRISEVQRALKTVTCSPRARAAASTRVFASAIALACSQALWTFAHSILNEKPFVLQIDTERCFTRVRQTFFR